MITHFIKKQSIKLKLKSFTNTIFVLLGYVSITYSLYSIRLCYFSSGGLSNFLYYVSLPDDIDSCNNVKNIKRARKDASPQEPKEV